MMIISDNKVKFSAKHKKSVFYCIDMLLYRNQCPINFILHFAIFHIGSSVKYFGWKSFCQMQNFRRILISFNCFLGGNTFGMFR